MVLRKLLDKLSPSVSRLLAIYPGRFQPFCKHHNEIYKLGINLFGEDNLYLTTSNKVEYPRSPFSFEEKKKIICKYGIPEERIIQTKRPYIPEELYDRLNVRPENVSLFVLIGEKDTDRFTSHYFKRFKNVNDFDTYLDAVTCGYLLTIPTCHLKMSNGVQYSGESVRELLSHSSKLSYSDIFGWDDPELFDMISRKMHNVFEQGVSKKSVGSSGNALGGKYPLPIFLK